MVAPAPQRSASTDAIRTFRPRPTFWWRSAVGGLLLFSFLGWFLCFNALYYQEIGVGVLTAGALWWLVGLIRKVRRASLILSPRGLALGTGKVRDRGLESVLLYGDVSGLADAPLPCEALWSRGIRGEGRRAVLNLATSRLGLIVPGALYDLAALERGLRDFGVREAAPGSPEASWPDEALLRQEAAERLAGIERPLRAGDGLGWQAGWLVGLGGVATLVVGIWLAMAQHPEAWIPLFVAGICLGFTVLILLWHSRLEVTSAELAVRSRFGGHGARWDQVTAIELGQYEILTIVAEHGWFWIPPLGSLRGPDAPAIRRAIEDVCLVRGLTPGPMTFHGFRSKGTRLPRER